MTQNASPSPPGEDSNASKPESAGIATPAAEQAKAVLSETGHQARQLLEHGVDELRGQARDGQRKLVGGLHGLADQLHDMSERSEAGMASDVVRQAAERTRAAASWLQTREPADLVQELRTFARRRPGVFLAGAAFAGALVGRLTRNMVTAAKNDEPDHGQHRHDFGPVDQAAESPNPMDGSTPGLPSATDPGYASPSGYAPPAHPAELDSVMTGTSGHHDTGPDRS